MTSTSGDVSQVPLSAAFLASTRRRYESSSNMDARIQRVYIEGPRKGAIKALATSFRWPEWAIKRRASELGLVCPRRPRPWSDREMWILSSREGAGHAAIRRRLLREGFQRSIAAIANEMRRRSYGGASERHNLEWVAAGFGVSPRVVRGWITSGQLRALQSEEGAGRGEWEISEDDIRLFVRGNPQSFRLRNVDQHWFLDLLTVDTFKPSAAVCERAINDIGRECLNN
ncbi:MAG: hypothetical protein ACREDR_21180 [Blastocatellia bacterium]